MRIDLSRYLQVDLSKFYLLDKQSLVNGLFYCGMLLAFLTTLRPWFLWSIYPFYTVLVSLILFAAMLIDRTSQKRSAFCRTDFLIPLLAYLVLSYYQQIVNLQNAFGFIINLFHAFIFYSLFRYDASRLKSMLTWFSKVMGAMLIPSLLAFFLYLANFSLPYSNAQYGEDMYTFSNYYFFLIEDGQLFSFFPRFQSVFPEPAYLGSTCALLLMTQRGHWKRWYNIVLLVALLFSFSLAGYVYIIVITFLNLWIQRKKIFAKAIAVVLLVGSVIGGSFFYNDGDNLIHNLILLRLEIEDGELEGNNRVTKDFDAEFDSFIQSSDILFGREKDNTFGDSGYKVFIYDYGFVGLFLLIVFYISAFHKAPDKRAMIAALIVCSLIFIVDAFVLWYARFLPLYATAYGDAADNKQAVTSTEQKEFQLQT